MIVHDQKKFTVPGTGDDVDAALHYLAVSSRLIVNQMVKARPQTAMDGYKNIWIVKDAVGLHRHRPVMLHKIGDVLDRCARPGAAADRIVQKYIEMPLLRNNIKSDVYTWIVLSTLGGRLTVWLHRTCVVQPYAHKFSLHRDAVKTGHFERFKTGGLHGMLRSTALICGLKQLGTKMRRVSKSADKVSHRRLNGNDSVVEHGDHVYTAVRRSVVLAVTAATVSGSINLRPNCLELFRGTFVLGDDLRPWLIDIVSDDPCLAADREVHDRLASPAATRATRTVVQGVAKMLIEISRRSHTRCGMFDVVHECPLPTGTKSYVPRLFAAASKSTFAKRQVAKKAQRPSMSRRVSSRVNHSDAFHQQYWWNDDNIHTYVEMISADDVQDQKLHDRPRLATGMLTAMSTVMVDDADLFIGSTENDDHRDPNESRRCLNLLDKYKTKVTSVQRMYKSIIRRNRNNKKRYT